MEESGEFYSELTKHDMSHQYQHRPNQAMLSRCQSSSVKRHHSSFSQRVQVHGPAQRAINNNSKSQLDQHVLDGRLNEFCPTKLRNSRLRTIDGCR